MAFVTNVEKNVPEYNQCGQGYIKRGISICSQSFTHRLNNVKYPYAKYISEIMCKEMAQKWKNGKTN